MNATALELEDASDAAEDFGEVFEDFVAGKLNCERLTPS
jgi:hypothetical protein